MMDKINLSQAVPQSRVPNATLPAKKAKSLSESVPGTGFEEALALINGTALSGLTGVNAPVIPLEGNNQEQGKNRVNAELNPSGLNKQPEIKNQSALIHSPIPQFTGSPVYDLKSGATSEKGGVELPSSNKLLPAELKLIEQKLMAQKPMTQNPMDVSPLETMPEGLQKAQDSDQQWQFPANDMKIAPEIAGLESLNKESRKSNSLNAKQGRGDAGKLAGNIKSDSSADPIANTLGHYLQQLDGEIEVPKETRSLRNRMSGNDFLETLRSVKGREGGENPIVNPLSSQQMLRVSEQSVSGPDSEAAQLAKENSVQASQPFLDVFSVKRFSEKDAEKWNSDSLQLEPERAHGVGNLNSVPQGIRQMPRVDVTGHVVPGAMARDRLSSESVLGMSKEVRNLLTKGGGEMRVRLKPENLGELQVRVVTNGRDVGLRIQASDEGSKQIIEGSIKHLRESLASQNLNLSKVDVSVASPNQPSWSGGTSDQALHQQPNQHLLQNWMGGAQEQGGQRQGLWEDDGESASGGRVLRTAQAAPIGNAWGSIGRVVGSDRQLDVRA